MLFPFLAAVSTAASILLLVLAYVRTSRTRPKDMRIRRLVETPEAPRRGLSWDELRRRGPSTLPFLRDLMLNSNWGASMTTEIEQAGLKLRVGEYVIARFGMAILTFLVIALAGRSLATTVLGLACAGIAFMLPKLFLSQMQRRRIAAITKQLPEAVTMMSNSLRAGFAFQHGMALVAEQMEPPIADEFTRMNVDMNLGNSVEDALLGLLKRADSEELHLLVTAILVQRTSGGNLAEILDNTGEHLREKERLMGEVRTMTSQQRFSGTVMTFWPLFLLGFFALLNWGQTKLLFTTTPGLVMLGVGAGLQLLGYFSIQRILDIEV